MKLTVLLLTVAFLGVHTNGFSQRISFSGVQIPLKKVFTVIEHQTEYVVLTTKDILANSKPVSANVQNMPLSDFLELILKDQSLNFRIADKTITVSKRPADISHLNINPKFNSAFKEVIGIIQGTDGKPLAGITVSVKGSTVGTTTDVAGKFTVNASTGDILIITGVGFLRQDIRIEQVFDLAISLEVKSNELESITVSAANTGYQSYKPNETNGSVTVVDNKKLNQQVSSNILQRINGVTNGVLFNIGKKDAQGYENVFSVRGLSTINGSTAPLIVLDNFPYEGDINNLNPNDIESITVLKDASATSIYGARGGNGVIVITSKKSRFNQKLRLEFNNVLTVSSAPDLFYLPRMSTSDYIDAEQTLFNGGFYSSQLSSFRYLTVSPLAEILLKRQIGILSAVDSSNQVDALKQIDIRREYEKYVYSGIVLRQHSLSLSGGNDNIAWTLAGAYNNGIDELNGKAEKINFRLSNIFKPAKNLQIGLNVYYTTNNSVSGKPAFAPNIKQYVKLIGESGTPLAVPASYRDAYTDTTGSGQLLDWKYYLMDDYKHNVTTNHSQNIVTDASLQYQLSKSLKIHFNYQYQKQWGTIEGHASVQSYYTRNIINLFTNLNAPINRPELRNPVPVGGILDVKSSNLISHKYRLQLNFDKEWHTHKIDALAGAEISETSQLGSGYTIYGYSKTPLLQKRVDFINSYPDYLTGSAIKIPGAPLVGGRELRRFISLYGNFAYTHRRKYSLSASVRRDASNIFGFNTNDRWNPLWSSGIGWELSKENFYNIKQIPYLRLKATWGYSGNVDLSKTALPVITYGGTYTYFPFASVSLGNPNLRWEKLRQLNIGLDFSVKNQKLSGSIEYYQKKGTDLYGPGPYDYTTYGGAFTLTQNLANMQATGVDVSLNFRVFDRKSFQLKTNLIFNYNNSITTKYFGDESQLGSSIVGSNGNQITPVLGKPLYAIAAYKWGGLNSSGDPQGYLDGKLSINYSAMYRRVGLKGIYSGDISYIGPSNPLFFGAFSNELTWKNFSLSFNVVYKLAYYFQTPTFSATQLTSGFTGHADFEKRWKQPGDEFLTHIPAFRYPYFSLPGSLGDLNERENFFTSAEIHVNKADNIRLQYINLIYSLINANQKTSLKQLDVYLNITNVGIIWKAYKGNIDPDYSTSIPPSASFSMGLRASL